MHKMTVNGFELEYDVVGSGEPVLLIGPGPIADGFMPLLAEEALADNYRLVRYRQRGQDGSTRLPAPVSFAEHAADAAALLEMLRIERAHVAGHSTGACIALQLAADHPALVHTLALLEPPLLGAPSAGSFLEKAQPAMEAYARAEPEIAMAAFLSMACGLEWETCRRTIEAHVPGGAAHAVELADALFAGYLPVLGSWQFGGNEADHIRQPVLSVLGTRSEQLFADGHEMLQAWFPNAEECVIAGVGHLLHIEQPEPVARAMAEFFARHPLERERHGGSRSSRGSMQSAGHR